MPTGAEGATERPAAARCPFCHEAVGASPAPATGGAEPETARDALAGLARVLCAACAAPHHAACFVEQRGCAASGCGSAECRRVPGGATIPVGVLAASLSPEGRAPLLVAVCFLALAVLLLVVMMIPGAAWLGALSLVPLAVLYVIRPRGAPRIRVEPVDSPANLLEDGALGTAFPGVFESADPYEPIRRHIQALEPDEPSGPAASGGANAPAAQAGAGPSPTACPTCGKALEAPDAGEALRFCYHCGVSLVGG